MLVLFSRISTDDPRSDFRRINMKRYAINKRLLLRLPLPLSDQIWKNPQVEKT